MSGSPENERGWNAGRIAVWVLGGLITLAVGTALGGVLLTRIFGHENLLLPFGVGFLLAAGYLAWLVWRAVRR